ncbi:MAG: dihydropteroate synthase, partial [Schaedlerella arabinosiphila]|nr:dihydropteroate synthase [Schaedlerella arabinosiphila]
ADVPALVSLLEGLRVDALGVNCGLGPVQMLPVLGELLSYASVPVIVKPNAGLPKQQGGETVYDVHPEEFARTMKVIVEKGAALIGGCCGTTPEHIGHMIRECKGMSVKPVCRKNLTMVSSYGQAVILGSGSKIIGERINPTGKKKFKQALKDHDLDYILKEGILQEENGAHILDVNVGLPDIDETAMMVEAVQGLQSVTSLPLQIDTVDIRAMEAAMRIYNGKPMVNSVSGKQESMDAVFPLIAKYGGVVVGLTLDEEGIPGTADGRIRVAEKIIREAARYGIEKKDLVIDVLAMTVSSEPQGAAVALEALGRVRKELGVHTVLGVSNISFGLPCRPILNANFYTMAMYSGLSAGIVNPSSEAMMEAYDAYHALLGFDENCGRYVEKYAGRRVREQAAVGQSPSGSERGQDVPADSGGSGTKGGPAMDLRAVIEKGLKEDAHRIAGTLVQTQEPLEIINT